MVGAWYMNEDESDQRLEHHKSPPEYISIEDLYKKTGVEYFKLNVDTYATDGVLDHMKEKRGITYEDEVACTKENLSNSAEALKSFFTEHMHADEEIMFILDGSGYFDVRDGADRWIRIAVAAGDMVVMPSGIYHRFTPDTNNCIKAKRLFIGTTVWTPHNRPADDMPCRKKYLEKQQNGFFAATGEGHAAF